MKKLVKNTRNLLYDIFFLVVRQKFVEILGVKLVLWHKGISPQMRYVLHQGYEMSDALLAQKYVLETDSVIECGSSIGFLSLFVKKRIGVKNYAMVEASPVAIEIAKLNYKLNKTELNQCTNAAISNKCGNVCFNIGEFKDEVQHGSEIHETPGTAS